MSACIVTAQLATIPTALWSAPAPTPGAAAALLAGFAALPLGGSLRVPDDPAALVATQVLDGVAAGAFDALLALVLADAMRGTGRYNAARGMVGTVQGVGGSLSNAVAGLLVVRAGYGVAFLALAAVALGALLLVLVAMPETRENANRDSVRAGA